MGKPLSDWLVSTKSPGRRVQVFAHSLGNLAVHSALTFLSSNTIDSYVMNAAPIASEAFDVSAGADTSVFQTGIETLAVHAISNGFSLPTADSDARWAAEWDSIITARDSPSDPELCLSATLNGLADGCGRGPYDNWLVSVGARDFNDDGFVNDDDLGAAYSIRWRQNRPTNWDPRTPPQSAVPSRGSWRGVFASNPAKVRTFVNTSNGGDFVVGFGWRAHQVLQKPAVGIRGLRSDSATVQFWANLPGTSPAESVVWSSGQAVDEAAKENTTRQWAELAFWFPSTTPGLAQLQTFNCSECFFTEMVKGTNPIESHTYLGRTRLSKIWLGFRTISEQLAK